MRFEWDPEKNRANRSKHGISFEDARELFTGGGDYFEIYDEAHSVDEDRFVAIGPIRMGIVVIAYTERYDDVVRIMSARMATRSEVRRFEEYWRRRR